MGAVRSKRPLELLHMDLCGPMPTESQGGNKYFLSIIDDYSRKVTVFPIRNKSDVFHTFIRFQKRAERFLSKKVIAVRTDGGLEFCNKDMDNFLTELGVKHEVTNSYTPEMNGVAERFNLTALDGIKTLLKSSEVPHKFWGEALLCFTYAWNRICHKDSNKTPFEKYSGRKPSILHLKPFGCLAYAGVPKQIRKKFDMRAKMGIMMGYAQRTKGYRIWLIDENKLVETINVRFDENKRGINFRQKVNSNLGYNLNLPDYSDDEDDSDRVKDSLTSRLVSKTSTEMPSTSEKPDVSSDNHSLIPCTEVKWIRNIGRKVTGSNVYYSIEGEATRLKSFNEIERYCKRHNIEYDPSLFNFRKDNTESQGFSDLSEQQEALMVEVTIPNCYKQAIRSRDASKGRDAMDKEINVMMERKVWDLVDHPDNIKVLENRWVYTIKYDENNKIVRYKTRLVARGNTQLRSESFDEVFQEYKLELSKVKSFKLRCYSDSDFATNRDDRVSMGGFITFIDETPISWRTFKQNSVSLSTMEAEYVSLTEAAKEFIWLKNVIDNKSLNLELSENVMFCDNQAAISFSKSPVENYRTKHIDVRYHFLRNLIYDKFTNKCNKKNEAAIRKSVISGTKLSTKFASYTRDVLLERTERAIAIWIKEQVQRRIPVSGYLIQEKALQFYKSMKKSEPSTSTSQAGKEFSASKGWLTGHDDIDELLVEDALSDNDIIDLTLDLTVDGVVGLEGDNDEEEKSTSLTGKLIQEGLQLCSKLENHFLINDPNSERTSKLQQTVSSDDEGDLKPLRKRCKPLSDSDND
ncbi:retrovirus-related Pol polyprotein from transposon TNT 1-94 [Trichonephila clavipes]|nr:retrovirus-related Pol polyprotein from transposon TNT 1-94 [Trichonephila clavipes]